MQQFSNQVSVDTSLMDQPQTIVATMPSLPQELVMEILTRVPVRSLLKFRCVSKSWCSLLSSSHFIKSHIKKSSESCNNHSLLLVSMGCLVQIYSCPLNSLLYERSAQNLSFAELPKQPMFPQASLLGCCNGIFGVLEGSHGLILWNPTIRKSKMLPNSGTKYGMFKIFSHGFGYDELNDDYKVVEICCFARHGINRVTILNVYSLRSNTWRRLKDYEGGIISSPSGVFINGILHWLVIHRDGFNTSWSILTLDISSDDDVYGELILPRYVSCEFNVTLGVQDERLCVFCSYYQLKMDVWMMNEYGKKESWFKFCSLPYRLNSRGGILPLFISRNGEILVRYGYSLMLYNVADDEYKDCDIRMLGPSFLGSAAPYIEGLASPHVYDNARDQN